MSILGSSPFKLIGKVAVVTGASSGIGLAACKSLLNCNALVLRVDVSPSHESTAARAGSHFQFYQCELSKPTSAADVVAAAQKSFGTEKIDILLNVAGIMATFQAVDTLDDEMWARVLAVTLEAPVWLMREILKAMKAQKSGVIVNVSSNAGVTGTSAHVAYTASKHALLGVTKNTAWRFKDDGIRCNAILPGGFTTNIAS